MRGTITLKQSFAYTANVDTQLSFPSSPVNEGLAGVSQLKFVEGHRFGKRLM